MTDLRLFDLNLLVAFDALMAERNVTRAARRISLGQPAMSHALSRLRELFGDELFVRVSGTMQPTTRALELALPISLVLGDIRKHVLADRAFKPEDTEMTFRVGALDHFELAVLPGVISALRASAPNACIAVLPIDREGSAVMLESGTVDLAVGYFAYPAGPLKREVLFHEEFVCLFDAGACEASAPIDMKTYIELPHIIMSPRGELTTSADEKLARDGAERFVFMATPHFLAIPYLLRGTRAIAAVPERLAVRCREVAGLTVSPLPIDLEGFDVSMQWHVRTDTDPAYRWFRDLVRSVARASSQVR